MLIEALIDEELSPGGGAVGVEALVAGHLQFGAEEERGVRIDQQQRVVAGGIGGRDRDAVGAGGFGFGEGPRPGRLGDGLLAVEGLELVEIDAFRYRRRCCLR